MRNLVDWLIANQAWVFGGVGTALVVAILGWILRPRGKPADKIKTHGNYSPGKVGGDYTVNDKK